MENAKNLGEELIKTDKDNQKLMGGLKATRKEGKKEKRKLYDAEIEAL